MSQQQPNSITSSPTQNPPGKKRGLGGQEKAMIGLSIVFFGGVLLLTVVPETFRGISMTLLTFLTVFVMFRAGR